MKYHFKKGDKVAIIAGKNKSSVGIIKKILMEKERVVLEGLNILKCFSKQKKQEGKVKEGSIHISNISHIDPLTSKPTRVKILIEEGVKKLYSVKSNQVIREIIDLNKQGLKKQTKVGKE